MGETIQVKLRKAFRIAWWCRHCWQRGELLVARGVDPSIVEGVAVLRHNFAAKRCNFPQVRVELGSRREVRLPEKRLIYDPLYVSNHV